MRLGATLAHLSDAPPFAVARWADRLVTAGFESLWTPHIIGRGSLIPDPFVTLATAAPVTQDVELGTATVQVPLYHPADLAHRVLSLMSVCGDRLILGISPGSTETDFATLDRDYTARFATFHRNTGRLRVLLAHGRDEHADLTPAAVAGGGPGAPARLVGRQCRAGSAGLRRLAGLRVPQHAGSDHRCPRALPGRRAANGRSCAPSRWTAGTTSSPPARYSAATPAPASMTPLYSSDPVGQIRRRSGPCSRGNRRRPETGMCRNGQCRVAEGQRAPAMSTRGPPLAAPSPAASLTYAGQTGMVAATKVDRGRTVTAARPIPGKGTGGTERGGGRQRRLSAGRQLETRDDHCITVRGGRRGSAARLAALRWPCGSWTGEAGTAYPGHHLPLTRDKRSLAAQPTTPTICSTSTRAKGWSRYCG